MATMTVRRVGDSLFVTKRGWIIQLKALWFVATHSPLAFIILVEAAIRTMTNPSAIALLFVTIDLPRWKEEDAKH